MLSIWGMLTLPQSPVPADVTTKLFSEPLFSSHTVAQLQAYISPDSPRCGSSPGPLLLQLCALHSLSLSVFSWIDKHNCLMVQRYQCSGNGRCHPGCFSPPSWDSLAQSSLTDPFPGTIILRTVLGVSICIIPINQQH